MVDSVPSLQASDELKTPPLQTEQGWEPELIIRILWSKIQISPILFCIDVPADAAAIPSGVGVFVWAGLRSGIA